MKRVKREGAAVVYVKRLSRIFFSNLMEMIREFQLRAFPKSPAIASGKCFIYWNNLVGGMLNQLWIGFFLFFSQTSLSLEIVPFFLGSTSFHLLIFFIPEIHPF